MCRVTVCTENFSRPKWLNGTSVLHVVQEDAKKMCGLLALDTSKCEELKKETA